MKPRILYYSDCYVFSGSENLLLNLFNDERINSRYEIEFCYRYSRTYDEAFKAKDIHVHSAYFRFVYANEVPGHLRMIGNNFFVNQLFGKFHRLLESFYVYGIISALPLYFRFRRDHPDIVHINNGGYPAAQTCLGAAVAAKLAGIDNVILTVNNLAHPRSSVPFMDILVDWVMSKIVKRFITASQAAGVALKERRRIPPCKVITINNTVVDEAILARIKKGALREEFGLASNVFVIGSVGLLTERKGFDVLLEALRILKSSSASVELRLFIFGEGEDRKLLEEYIEKHHLRGTAFLPGYRKDVYRYMADFDVFVLPSVDYEDFPYVILEALLMGIPIIGTSVAGIPEAVSNGVNGSIVTPRDPDSLAEKIKELGKSRGRRQEISQANRSKYFELYNNEKTISKYLSLYARLANEEDSSSY